MSPRERPAKRAVCRSSDRANAPAGDRVVVSRCVRSSEQDRLTIERSTDGLGSDPAAAKDDDPIGHPDDLLGVVANEDDRDPLDRQLRNDAMDFRLCSDVNASCRFVKNEDSWGWN